MAEEELQERRPRNEVFRDLRSVMSALETFGADSAASVVREAMTYLLDDEAREKYLGYANVEMELEHLRASRQEK